MKELLTQAALNLKGKDEELDVEAGREAKWSSHSLRRLADTTARRFRVDMDVTEAEIDLYFGWHERCCSKKRRWHSLLYLHTHFTLSCTFTHTHSCQ